MLQSFLQCSTFQVETARAWTLSWGQVSCWCLYLRIWKASCTQRQFEHLPCYKLRKDSHLLDWLLEYAYREADAGNHSSAELLSSFTLKRAS